MKRDTKRADAIYPRVLGFWREQGLIPRGSSVLIALSGGKDSVCMLRLLCRARDELSLRLYACHVHHGLRAEADGELEFCRRLCEELGVSFHFIRADAAASAKEWGIGVEEAGRRIRYGYFENLADSLRADLIATAHTASDNTETVIMDLVRGAGLSGLGGIPPRRGRIVRPILCLESREVEEYLENIGQDHVTDRSNLTGEYRRNRIRASVIPALREENPALDRVVFSNSLLLREENGLLDALCRAALEGIVSPDGLSCDKQKLRELCGQPSMRGLCSRWIRSAAGALGAGVPDRDRCRALEEACLGSPAGKRLQLKNGVSLLVGQKTLRFARDTGDQGYRVVLSPGETKVPRAGFAIRLSEPFEDDNYKNINKLSMIMKINPDKIMGELCVRSRREGDTVRMGSMTRSVKKLICDLKPDPVRKKLWPVVCDDGGILWIPGAGLCDRIRPAGPRQIRISIEFFDPEG